MPELSLVVATYNRTRELSILLESLSEQSSSDFETIIIDQNSDDRLVDIVARYKECGLSISHIRQDKPDQNIARNCGINLANGRIVAFPDDDCWYAPTTVASILAAFKGENLDGLVGNWIEKPYPKIEKHRIDWMDARKFRSPGASMICQFYLTAVVRSVGGFDGRLGLNSWFGASEDTDLFFKILSSRKNIYFVPEVEVHHKNDPVHVLHQVDRKRLRSRARGTGALYAKHRLSTYVIIRGFFAPTLKCFTPRNFRNLTLATQMSIGRMEGYLAWLRQYG